MGFESVGAFKQIGADSIDEFFISFETTIREIALRHDDDALKQEVAKDLKDAKRNLNANFVLPMGHRNVIKSIIDYCKMPPPLPYIIFENPQEFSNVQSPSLSSPSTSGSSKVDIQNTSETFTTLCQKHVADELIKGLVPLRDLYVYMKDNDWVVDCPFCTRSLKLSIVKGSHKTWNFQKHLINVHRTVQLTSNKKSPLVKQKVEVINVENIESTIEFTGNKDGDKILETSDNSKEKSIERSTSGSSNEKSPPQKVLLLGNTAIQKIVSVREKPKINEVRIFS